MISSTDGIFLEKSAKQMPNLTPRMLKHFFKHCHVSVLKPEVTINTMRSFHFLTLFVILCSGANGEEMIELIVFVLYHIKRI